MPNFSIFSQSSAEAHKIRVLLLYGWLAQECDSSSSSSGNTGRGCFATLLAKGNFCSDCEFLLLKPKR